MGYAFCIGECYTCGRQFTFNPLRVPSWRDSEGVRRPLCRPCVEHINGERAKQGREPFTIPADAYEPIDENELP